jgi:hypothetical protein
MKILFTASCLAALALASGGAASKSAPQKQVLRGNECLDPDYARNWINLDDRTLLVDTGRYRYRIQVSGSCTALSYTNTMVFRGDPVTGLVCGGVGDAIITRDYPCQISSMELIDKQVYKQLVDQYNADRKQRRAARKSGAP